MSLPNMGRSVVVTLIAMMFVSPVSATSIIVDFTQERIVLVADSRAIRDTPAKVFDDDCKLDVLGGEFVFAAMGDIVYLPDSPTDPVPEWHARDDAVRAYRVAPSHSLYAVAQDWMEEEIVHFKTHYLTNPTAVERIAARQNGGLVLGIFAGKNEEGNLAVYEVTIHLDNQPRFIPTMPSVAPILHEMWMVKPQTVSSQNALTQELIDGQTERAKESAEEWMREARKIPKAEQDVRRLEFLVRETGHFDSSVGGPTNAVSISGKGVSWLHKRTCK